MRWNCVVVNPHGSKKQRLMLNYWFHLIAAHFYQVWAAIGPLVGVILGAWLTARWQRKKWILDNKTAEYRGILDALNSYRFMLIDYHAHYYPGATGFLMKDKHDAQIALARANDAVTNGFADRIFTRMAVDQSGAREDWSTCAKMFSAGPIDINPTLKVLDGTHDKLVKASQADLKLQDI
jgi:hypothetical protein